MSMKNALALLTAALLLAGCLETLETPSPEQRALANEDATTPASAPAPVEESMQTPAITKNMTTPAAVGEWINSTDVDIQLATWAVDKTDREMTSLTFEVQRRTDVEIRIEAAWLPGLTRGISGNGTASVMFSGSPDAAIASTQLVTVRLMQVNEDGTGHEIVTDPPMTWRVDPTAL